LDFSQASFVRSPLSSWTSLPTLNDEPMAFASPTPPDSFASVVADLAAKGVRLRAVAGEYSVNFTGGGPLTDYRSDDLADAIEHGRAMARSVRPAEPPLGPIGRRSRRGLMIRHNRKIAARRARAARQKNAAQDRRDDE
jgi:hypothetical protein